MAVTSKITFYNPSNTASYFTIRLDYTVTRSGSNVTVNATPIMQVEGSGSGWYNDRIYIDVSIGGTYTGNVQLKGATSGTIVGKTYKASVRSRTYSNTSTTVPISMKITNDNTKKSLGTFTTSLVAPAAVPATPGASIGSITRNSFKVSWSSSMSASAVRYHLPGGSWTNPGGSGTSGAFNITGLSHGKSYTVNVQVQGPGGWSATRAVTASTLNVSYLSSLVAKPRFGTNNVLDLTFAKSQTGGSTTVRYRISGGSWSGYTSGTTGAISGLANNTNYTIQFEALNSNGQVSSYSTTGRTHAAPTGSFTIGQTNKKNLNVSIGAVSNATVRRLSLNNGSWIDTPGNRVFSVSPGTAYNVRMQLYSSTTGLTYTTGYQNITMASLAKITSFSVVSRTRTSATIRMAFSDNVNQITLSVGTTSNEVQNITSGRTFDLPITKSGLVSGTNYTLTVRVRDTNNGGYNGNQSYTFATAAFLPPTVSMAPSLSSITATYTIRDSCKVSGESTIRTSGQKVTVKFGGNLAAATAYSFTTKFVDQYKAGDVSVTGTATTSSIPTISAYSSSPNTISSLGGAYPHLSLTLSDSRYSKRIVYTIGGKTITRTLASGVSKDTYLLTKTQVEDIMKATTSSIKSPVKAQVYFTESGVESVSSRTSTLDVTLQGSILAVAVPTSDKILYTSAGGLDLTALVSSSLNSAVFTVPVQENPLGGTIVKESLLFQGKIYNVGKSREVTVSGVNSFNAGKGFQIEITDSRGLVNRRAFDVSTYEYSNPVLTVTEINRNNGGFGEDLIMNNFGAVWSSPPTTGDKNKLKGILLRVTNQARVTDDYGIIIPDTDLETAGTGQITKTFPSTEILSKSLESIGKVFLTNYAYRLTFVAQDLFGREALIRDYAISTGEPAMFIDSANRVVGFSTVAPRGAAEVNGDFYATKQFSLNGLFFSESDLTDL